MTVHTIDTSFQYPAPDMNKIYKSREELNYKIRTLGNLYLPVLAEELKGLEKEINTTDAQALKAITLIPSALQTSEIQQYYTIIENLKNENPTSEQKEAIDSFYGEIKSLIGNSTTETLKLFTELNNSLTNLQAVTLSDNQYRINELDTSILKISPQLSEEESAIERLVTDEAALNEAIKIIEAIDTFSLIKDAFSASKNWRLSICPHLNLSWLKQVLARPEKSWIWSATPSSMTIWSQPGARLKQNWIIVVSISPASRKN